ncbi:MAG TPA: SCP2 sterol-binding domain-containing protein [Acidimicrobiales bacterium]|nr:SCP2 sterol-binding domain-containing protein [Acidimicrobiales bacterium]
MVRHLSEDWVALHTKVGGGLPERPGASARLQHVVTGAPDGEVAWSLVLEDGRVADAAVGRDDDAADCTFLITHPDSVLIARGELDLHAGFMQGRVKMSGDMGRLMAVLPCTQSDEFRAALAEVASTTEF